MNDLHKIRIFIIITIFLQVLKSVDFIEVLKNFYIHSIKQPMSYRIITDNIPYEMGSETLNKNASAPT